MRCASSEGARISERDETTRQLVNQLVREYLQQLTSRDDPESDIEELRQLSADAEGRSHGWSFNRDEIHERA